MADSFQNEVPKARINLKLDLHTIPLFIATRTFALPFPERIIEQWFDKYQINGCLNQNKKILKNLSLKITKIRP